MNELQLPDENNKRKCCFLNEKTGMDLVKWCFTYVSIYIIGSFIKWKCSSGNPLHLYPYHKSDQSFRISKSLHVFIFHCSVWSWQVIHEVTAWDSFSIASGMDFYTWNNLYISVLNLPQTYISQNLVILWISFLKMDVALGTFINLAW